MQNDCNIFNHQKRDSIQQAVLAYFQKEPSYNDRNLQLALIEGQKKLIEMTLEEDGIISAEFTEKILSVSVHEKWMKVTVTFKFQFTNSVAMMDITMRVYPKIGIDMENGFETNWST